MIIISDRCIVDDGTLCVCRTTYADVFMITFKQHVQRPDSVRMK